ncbi:galactose-1-epimerase [Pasteurella langaaensis]|nr:galactose-1-epimerase [Pasteurella langaaensis]
MLTNSPTFTKTTTKPTALSRCGTAPDGEPFQIFTLTNSQGMQVKIMDWGATWISCKVPVQGQLREVLLGCQPEDYIKQTAYLGASIGRYANRIAHAAKLGLTTNQGQHQLHGGLGWDKVRWKLDEFCENFVRFRHFSADGDQGFAGNVVAFALFQLNDDNSLTITYQAENGQDTPLNLTNHAYFNLYRENADVREHFLQVNTDQFLPVDSEGIPNAPLKSVEQTSFDFRTEKIIHADFLKEEQALTKGYDHAFLLNKNETKPCAILTAPDRSLRLEVSTSQSALQVYTGNYLADTPTRNGGAYQDYSGIALETQALPDTPNHPEWWQYGGMAKAGESYQHWTKFKFIA